MKSSDDSPTPRPPCSGETVTITLPGWIPLSARNQRHHWTQTLREKRRAQEAFSRATISVGQASIKEAQDILVTLGWLPGDGWNELTGSARSVRVRTRAEQRTEIKITRIDNE
jgi:hypothetical protein